MICIRPYIICTWRWLCHVGSSTRGQGFYYDQKNRYEKKWGFAVRSSSSVYNWQTLTRHDVNTARLPYRYSVWLWLHDFFNTSICNCLKNMEWCRWTLPLLRGKGQGMSEDRRSEEHNFVSGGKKKGLKRSSGNNTIWDLQKHSKWNANNLETFLLSKRNTRSVRKRLKQTWIPTWHRLPFVISCRSSRTWIGLKARNSPSTVSGAIWLKNWTIETMCY